MANRPTMADLARAAGVSVATVDRVLNGRAAVREETAQRIYAVAHEIGYHAAAVIKQRMQAELPDMPLGFVLQKERQAFYRTFADEIDEAVRLAQGVRATARIVFAAAQDPKEVVALMTALAPKVRGIAAVAVDHHDITNAVAALKAKGVPTFALLSDFAQGVRHSYIGLNNIKVGRIAAWTIAKTAKPGKVALFVGGHRWHGHALRETGFRSYFREHAPQFQVLDTLVNLETRRLTYEATLDLLERHPDLRGFYVAGGGMEGAIAAARETRKPEEIAIVVNEVTPESTEGLQDRYVTLVDATPLRRLCQDLVGLMIDAARQGVSITPGQHFLPPDLLVPESV
ncbi:MAG: LacI family transcriptional regulator [Rhizobiales bacterium]|nr:LacI family transcriptional regulator [Hyphomicrobiales bacterium]